MDEELKNQEESEEESKSAISADLIRGHINTIILRTLYERDKYGYEIIEDIEAKSHGQYSLKQPTLYSALKRLESQGYITAYWKTDEVSNGGRRKYYTLTETGREITEKNQAEWEYSRTVIDSLISDRNFDFTQPAPTSVDFKILKSSTSRVPTLKGGDNYDEEDADDVREVEHNEKHSYVAHEEVEQLADAQTVFETTTEQPIVQSVQYTAEQPLEEKLQETETSKKAQAAEVTEEQSETAQAAEVTEEQSEAVQAAEVTEEQSVTQPTQQDEALPPEQEATTQPEVQQLQEVVQQISQVVEQMQQVVQPAQGAPVQQAQTVPIEETVQYTHPSQPVQQPTAYDRQSEERRIHENYLRLISEPIVEQNETPTVPYSENIDTEKLIYNNKPETERDYKNLINNLFVKTVKQQRQQEPEHVNPIQQVPVQVSYEDASVKASQDGLTVNSSEYTVTGSKRKKYNRGITLFKCSLIVSVILLFEFALSLAFHKALGVGIGYPFVILAIAVAQLAIFGILTTTDFGKCTRKPTSHSYLTASVVLSVILILIVFLSSLLFDIKFSVAGDVIAKIIIPSLVVLNIPIFSTIFYFFSK